MSKIKKLLGSDNADITRNEFLRIQFESDDELQKYKAGVIAKSREQAHQFIDDKENEQFMIISPKIAGYRVEVDVMCAVHGTIDDMAAAITSLRRAETGLMESCVQNMPEDDLDQLITLIRQNTNDDDND